LAFSTTDISVLSSRLVTRAHTALAGLTPASRLDERDVESWVAVSPSRVTRSRWASRGEATLASSGVYANAGDDASRTATARVECGRGITGGASVV
jgi:hypothetical protein